VTDEAGDGSAAGDLARADDGVQVGDPLPPPDRAEVAALGAAHADVLASIADAARRVGRDPATVTLVAVSKTVPAPRVRAAVAAGIVTLGENRVQEAAEKVPLVPGARWHLVGPLQANKARRALELFDVIEAVDSPELARRLDRITREIRGLPAAGAVPPRLRVRILLEVNVDRDPTKAGFDPDDLAARLPGLEALDALDLRGLMTIGRFAGTPDEARATFVALRRLSERLRARPGARLGEALSMGMSGDYPVAVEEGATIVRVGTAIFGERQEARDRAGVPGRDRRPR
jgi:pyridoxal phosphate enzyme (YggS family)